MWIIRMHTDRGWSAIARCVLSALSQMATTRSQLQMQRRRRLLGELIQFMPSHGREE